MSETTKDDLAKRRVPALITYLSPFRIVEKDDAAEPWSATIQQVNRGSWDYVALHEIMGGVNVGLETPYHMVVARDGALALPPIPELRSDQVAVEYFNRCLAALLLGGIYCEAINLDSLELGCIIDWKYVRSQRTGTSAANNFHNHIRYQNASALEAIHLYRPRSVKLSALYSAMRTGLDALKRLEPMRGEYLLKGATGLARRDWGTALANLWIVTEQLIEALWNREIVKPTRFLDNSKMRRDQLNDNRIWTAATRIEMLHQKGAFDLAVLKALSKARKARNNLSHSGVHPAEVDAYNCYAGVRALITTVLADNTLPLLQLDLSDHAISDPFAPQKGRKSFKPTFWMAIPKLPGEQELEKAEARLRHQAASKDSQTEWSDRNGPELDPDGKRNIARPQKNPASPSPSQLIDAKIEALDDWRGAMLVRVRSVIKKADPEIVEEVKWRKPSNPNGVPVWEHSGIICTGETYKDKVKLTFAKGASLDDPSGLFNASLEGNARRAIDLQEGDKIDEKALKALIRAAVTLNTSHANSRPAGAQKKKKGV
ncbi:hypothetical protein SAMN04488061_2668 [Filomicrobium insigne]|uniref:YdhG-like domain-containing protein n=2 Tax=Filomicrobium insigne TaxID=418854 RepID=A0A1H0RB19_9HYPH|nr:hypothetical protein SAMN04488061_2668 [Filomicrobium insigne]